MFKGFQGTTLIDYPGKVASILFTAGCNFTCPYCYNKQLVVKGLYAKIPDIPKERIFSLLEERKNFIEGVVITGGEPLLHFSKLKKILNQIKQKFPQFPIKLDTNGAYQEELEELLQNKLISYVAVDLKTSFPKYDFFTSDKKIEEKLQKTISILRKNLTTNEYEFRTTVIRPFFTAEDIQEISSLLKENERYFLQQLKIIEDLMLDYAKLKDKEPLIYKKDELLKLLSPFKEKGVKVHLRGF